MRETREGFRRDPTSLSGEEMLELALSGLGGGVTKIKKPVDLASRRLSKLIGEIKGGLETGDLSRLLGEARITPERFAKNPEKYSKFLVANYKLTPLQDKEVMLRAARHIIDNPERVSGAGIDFQGRARKVLMRLGKPEVISTEPTKMLMRRFSKEGLHYDAFTEPVPGMGYHQWTLYGETPAKGATFGTKGTSLEEMERKIAELLRKFRKE